MQAPKKTPIMLARAQFRSVLGWLVLFSLVVNLLLLVMPLYMLQVYDRILPSQSMQTLIFLSIFAVGALVVLGLLEAVRAVIAGRAAARLETTLGAETMRIAMMRGRATGGDIQPVRDLAAVRTFLASRSLFALLDLPFAPLFIALLYIIHPILFWITVGGAVVLFLVAILNQWVTSSPSTLAGQRQGGALMSAQAMSRNSDTLQAMGMVGNAIAKWGQSNSEALTAQGIVDTRNAVLSGISRTIRMGLQIAILGVGAWLVLAGEMTAGMIFAASIISGRGLQPIDQVIGGWKQFVVTWRSWQKLADLLERVPQQQERTEMEAPRGEVLVEAALVAASGGMGEAPILNRVSFKAEAGTIIGIVGPSGSGKSTLARLLVGAQMPNAGLVRVDGNDIRNWAPEQIGAAIGYLGQEPELLPASVKENIARLTPNASDEAVRSAAQNAQVHDLIQTFPQGYDTWLGPGGLQLSGGQKQRIALARAFFGSPRLIVLDEPNANLDETGERALHAALMNARASGATVFIVTQRDSALAAVDKVLRLVNGGIDFYDTRLNFVQAVGAARKAANDAAAAARAGEAAKPRPQVVTKDGRPVAPMPQRPTPGTAGSAGDAGSVSPRDAFLKRFGTDGAADGRKPGDAS